MRMRTADAPGHDGGRSKGASTGSTCIHRTPRSHPCVFICMHACIQMNQKRLFRRMHPARRAVQLFFFGLVKAHRSTLSSLTKHLGPTNEDPTGRHAMEHSGDAGTPAWGQASTKIHGAAGRLTRGRCKQGCGCCSSRGRGRPAAGVAGPAAGRHRGTTPDAALQPPPARRIAHRRLLLSSVASTASAACRLTCWSCGGRSDSNTRAGWSSLSCGTCTPRGPAWCSRYAVHLRASARTVMSDRLG